MYFNNLFLINSVASILATELPSIKVNFMDVCTDSVEARTFDYFLRLCNSIGVHKIIMQTCFDQKKMRHLMPREGGNV